MWSFRRRGREDRPSSAPLNASDAYSDLVLGRSPATHPHRAVDESSQIDDRDRPGELDLPERRD